MKKKFIEFIKEVHPLTGEIYFYTEINSELIKESMKTDEQEARKIFNLLYLNKGNIENQKVILETKEIELL